MEPNVIDFLLEEKRDRREEFMITLFEKCNLACAFCWQDHDNREGLDTIRDKVDSLVKAAKNSPKTGMLFNLMGGEMFADDIFTDKMFADYVFLITETYQQVKALGKTADFTCCTNLIYSNVEKVQQFLDEIKSNGIKIGLSISYDFTGRFNPNDLKVFMKNTEFFKKEVINIGIVLTAPNIIALLKNNDEAFKCLYNSGFHIFFDYYSPEKNAAVMTPSDALLLEAFYFLIDNYPNTQPVKNWITQTNNQLTCKSSKVLLPSGEMVQCGKLPDEKTIKFFKKPNQMSNTAMEESFMEQMGCLTCEYFTRCSLGCFLQHYFKGRDELNECVYKLMFDKITKNQVVEEIYQRMASRQK